MSILYRDTKKKKEVYGIAKHDVYSTVIPYKIVKAAELKDDMYLYATSSQKTNTIRLHTKQPKESTTIQVRQFLTKTYKKKRNYSTKVTIPINFIKELDLNKGDIIDIDYSNTTITIKKHKKPDTNSS